MYTISQWIHQHNLILFGSVVVAAVGLLPVLYRRSLRLWLLWFAVVGLVAAGLFSLRTADVSVTSHPDPAFDIDSATAQILFTEPQLESVAAIEQFLADGGKLTLVEVQSDFGLA